MPVTRQVLVTLLALPISLGRVQAPAAQRQEILDFVKAYADATNRGDMTAYVDMYSRRSDLIVVNDGEITRGIDAVRNEANQTLGLEGRYKISVGTIDVIPLGQTRAIAVFPFAMTVQSEQGPVQIRAAMTLVLEKGSQGWKIIHDHTSSAASQGE
jgi:ketosteroid isomerase-like protein